MHMWSKEVIEISSMNIEQFSSIPEWSPNLSSIGILILFQQFEIFSVFFETFRPTSFLKFWPISCNVHHFLANN